MTHERRNVRRGGRTEVRRVWPCTHSHSGQRATQPITESAVACNVQHAAYRVVLQSASAPSSDDPQREQRRMLLYVPVRWIRSGLSDAVVASKTARDRPPSHEMQSCKRPLHHVPTLRFIVGETERTAITIGCMADATQRCAGAKRIPKIRQPSGNRSPVDSAESVRTSTANRSSRQAVRAKTKEPIGGGCASGRPCRVHG